MKYKENNIEKLVQLAKKKKGFVLVSFVFSGDNLPDIFSVKYKKIIFYIFMMPIFASAAIALAFARSDWKYEVSSPLMGASSLAMLCLMTYGNFISFFYFIHYLRNKEKYAEFANWPREKFADKG